MKLFLYNYYDRYDNIRCRLNCLTFCNNPTSFYFYSTGLVISCIHDSHIILCQQYRKIDYIYGIDTLLWAVKSLNVE